METTFVKEIYEEIAEHFENTRKGPLCGHFLAPLEGLCAPGEGVEGSTPGVNHRVRR